MSFIINYELGDSYTLDCLSMVWNGYGHELDYDDRQGLIENDLVKWEGKTVSMPLGSFWHIDEFHLTDKGVELLNTKSTLIKTQS